MLEYIESNPGASYEEIVQRVINTVPGRVTRQLEELEGREIRATGDGYRTLTSDEGDQS